ncbi:hypothetical protein P7C73_g43, partial [Tremellales sp. Uapishka_1]
MSSIAKYDSITYSDFLTKHLQPNLPLLLSSTETSTWPSRSFSLASLRKYGAHVVPVANTLKRQYSEFERDERPLSEVLDLWEKHDPRGDGLYVKDWHLMDEIERDGGWVGGVYSPPECFRGMSNMERRISMALMSAQTDDWLNPPFLETPSKRAAHSPDFRFTYLGPRDTFTPLHRDVYSSYSWSANVVGRKKWWIFPPDRLDNVKRDGEFVFDVREMQDEGGGIVVIQEEGEVIFIPSGWYHQVLNLDFCISINHNFFSSPALPRVFESLREAQKRVEESIYDVKEMIIERLGSAGPWEKEWVAEVQALLEMDAGWGWRGFWECVLHNMKTPPARKDLSPPVKMRDGFVREIISAYKETREWHVLEDVRTLVEEVQGLL